MRRAAVRNFGLAFVACASLALLPERGLAELPPRGETLDPEAWGAYTLRLLGNLAAEWRVAGVRVNVGIATRRIAGRTFFFGFFAERPDTLVITESAVRFLDSEEEFRVLLAHELAHRVLGDRPSFNAAVTMHEELAADDWALAHLGPAAACILADFLARVERSERATGVLWARGSLPKLRLDRARSRCIDAARTLLAENACRAGPRAVFSRAPLPVCADSPPGASFPSPAPSPLVTTVSPDECP